MRKTFTLALVAGSIALAACGGTTNSLPSNAVMEKQIRDDYQAQIEADGDGTDGAVYRVDSVECVKNANTARCFAVISDVADSSAPVTRVAIRVTPGDDGTFIWESDAS